jgi:nicotinamide-nucleotide amidase
MDYLKRVERILNLFRKENKMIAFAESCTGGYICHMITNISGSSKVFERGIVCYSNEAKIEMVNVDKQIIEQNGAISEEVAQQLSQGIRELSGVDVGIGITGIAGPTGGTLEKPVGLVYIGFSSREETFVKKQIFDADRLKFKNLVLEEVLLLLEKYIKKEKK